jgi:hypothetical protein
MGGDLMTLAFPFENSLCGSKLAANLLLYRKIQLTGGLNDEETSP